MINVQQFLRLQYTNIKYVRGLRCVINNNCVRSHSYLMFNSSNRRKYPILHKNKVFSTLYSTSAASSNAELQVDTSIFDKACEETLESLTEFFEEVVESTDKFVNGDVSYSDGVLTVNLGTFGIYVINRQAPNKQIWLSSPISGPKRYDFVVNGSYWIYKHDLVSLHELLQSEISKILGKKTNVIFASGAFLNTMKKVKNMQKVNIK